jgi:hypothetical protein
LDLAASLGEEFVSVTWLEEALEHAYTHGQIKTLAYLEAVIEDAVFVMEMAATGKASSVG